MAEISLKANLRTVANKGANKKLRREKRVPGVYYAKTAEPIVIDVAENALNPLIYTAETHLVSLEIEGREPLSCVVKEFQFDPVTDRPVHFDLQGISKDEKVQVEVPVVITGTAVGIKNGGLLQHSVHKLEVECLAIHMPEHIVIDVKKLELGAAIHVGDLKYDNLTFITPAETAIVSVVHQRAEEKTDEEKTAEPEIIKKGKTEEA
jgi:large subunit ribosomal protein L25